MAFARRASFRLILTLCGVIAIAITTSAQEYRGTIEGRVTDESGAALPGVGVTVTNLATGVIAAAVSNSEGRYLVPLLSPGFYRVLFELQGFRRCPTAIQWSSG